MDIGSKGWASPEACDRPAGADEPRERLAGKLNRLFAAWGYRFVEPPLVEDLATFRQSSPGLSDERVYRFLDHESRLLALRPDMTAGIARMVALGLAGTTRDLAGRLLPAADVFPLRLRYEGSVFRNEAPGSGRSRAIRQAGVELIGDGGLEADAEVIALAVAAAQAAGASEACLVLGHVDLAWGAFALAGAGPAAKTVFRRAIADRDLVALESLLGLELAGLFAGGPYALADAVKLLDSLAAPGGDLAAAAAQVRSLLESLPAYGVHDALLDLSLLRDLDYYSGVVFELIQPGQAEPLAGGGRYDRLLGQFGRDLPATGFALNLDVAAPAPGRLAEAMSRYAVAWEKGADRAPALAIAASLRADGLVVESLAAGLSLREAMARARSRGCGRLLHVSDGGYREVRLDLGLPQATLASASAGGGGIH